MVKKVNWGIIGLGNVALHFANTIKLISDANLKGIASKTDDKIQKFQNQFNIESEYSFNDYNKLINSNDIDAIYIALPNSMHCEFIIKCIRAKKKILVEKPATLNFQEIKNINNKYDMKNYFFSEGFMYLHHPQISKIIGLLKSKVIGNIVSMKSNFGKDILTKKNFLGFKVRKKENIKNRLFNPRLGGGAILDLGCYPVSFSILVASISMNIDISKIQLSNIKKKTGSSGVDIDSYAEIKFNNSFKSFIRASFTKNIGSESEIIGEKGKLVITDTWHANPSIIKVIGNEKKIFSTKFEYNSYYYQIKNITKNILENKKTPDYPAMNFDRSYLNMCILENWKNEK